MPFVSMRRPRLELLAIKLQLVDRVISSTDAAKLVGEILFDEPKFMSTPATEAWRKYDQELIEKTIAMIDEVLK